MPTPTKPSLRKLTSAGFLISKKPPRLLLLKLRIMKLLKTQLTWKIQQWQRCGTIGEAVEVAVADSAVSEVVTGGEAATTVEVVVAVANHWDPDTHKP